MRTLRIPNPLKRPFTTAGKIGINGILALGITLGGTAGAVTLAPAASAGPAYGSCATDNGIRHCESYRFERRMALGQAIWEKNADVRYPDGTMIFEHARYWGDPPEYDAAMGFLPRFNGQGIDKAVDAPWCVDHT